MFEIVRATTPEQMVTARELFREFQQSLGIDLCFQGFEEELAGLPGKYAPPGGTLLLAIDGNLAGGCVALRPLEEGVCEMKRLYVRPSARGAKLGKRLVEEVIAFARSRGYSVMRLDTLPGLMDTAIEMYRRAGFREIAPYCHNPVKGVLFLELTL